MEEKEENIDALDISRLLLSIENYSKSNYLDH